MFYDANETEIDLSEIYCPSCKAHIPEEAIDPHTMIASCAKCEKKAKLKLDRPKVAMPQNFEMQSNEHRLDIYMHWLRTSHFGEAIALVVFLLLFNYLFFFEELTFEGAFDTYFPIIFYATQVVAIVITAGRLYYAWKKAIIVRVTKEKLSVIQDFSGKEKVLAELDVTHLDQVFCERKHSMRNDKNFNFNLKARTKDGQQVMLIKKLHNEKEARFIEQEIESFLKVDDVHVPGGYLPDHDHPLY